MEPCVFGGPPCRQRDRSCMIDNNARHVTRIVNKLKSYYRDQAVKEDCPICLENIETDKLYIPGCCHYLCEPCAQHVIQLNNKCPICRDDMYTTIGEYMPFLPEYTDQLENDAVINA